MFVKRANIGFDFRAAQMHFGAVIVHVLHFRVNAKLFSGSENDGFEEVAVRTALQLRHRLRQLSMSP